MELVRQEVRTFVYTVICFQCILQLLEGSAYYKYIKLFSYLITICICCNMVFSLVNHFEGELPLAKAQYEEWIKEWEDIQVIGRMDD